MKQWGLIIPILIFSNTLVFSQNQFKAIVKDKESNEVLIGVNAAVKGMKLGGTSDADGVLVIRNVPNGKQAIIFSMIGHESISESFDFPLSDDKPIIIFLHHSHEHLEEVVVSATRTGRMIEDEPIRVEVIDGEELDEKANMAPANIAVALKESTGIQVQQTSATSANQTFRIQGLDGRYTQLLLDGFPMFGGFSGGLSILQIPPLNLKQIEIIKGSNSTLYGGGAIAGLVNLVTKEPMNEREISGMINYTSAKGLDLNTFYAQKFGKIGVSLYATRNTQEAYDPNDDHMSDIPKISRYTLNPKLYFYLSERTKLGIGLNYATEKRTGGYLPAIDGDVKDGFKEQNNSDRWATTFKLEHRMGESGKLTVKNTFNGFNRTIQLPDYQFDAVQQASFSEINYFNHQAKNDWIVGLNMWTDHFTDKAPYTIPIGINPPIINRSYKQLVLGGFVQHTLNVSEKLTLESGLRLDVASSTSEYTTGATKTQSFLLPRLSMLYKINEHWSSRLGGGLGYKTPTLFTEESEQIYFRQLRSLPFGTLKSEQSVGLNWDVNYKVKVGEESTLSMNQLLFVTRLNDPLTLASGQILGENYYFFQNGNGHINVQGLETNVRLNLPHFHIFWGYSFIDTKRAYNQLNNEIPLTARHKLYNVVMYEIEDELRVGLEAYYVGSQRLNTGLATRSYWTCGFMVEKKWEHFSIYINFENFLDARQSRWQAMFSGTVQQPKFVTDIYAPTDGRIINGGIKIRL